MIKATFGLTQEPFCQDSPLLLPQQQEVFDILKVHSQHGGFSVVVGEPGTGKTVLLEHLKALAKSPETVVITASQTMHTYGKLLTLLAESLKVEAPSNRLEKTLIQTAFHHVRENRTLYTLIDEAHLMHHSTLRRFRLLFDRFPKNHNLILFGQSELLHQLSLSHNEDIKSRITYSARLLDLTDHTLRQFILSELERVRLKPTTFDEGALELIVRCVEGNLRLCVNLAYGSLLEACRDGQKEVSIQHVNNVLIQPHWRSYEELIRQPARQTEPTAKGQIIDEPF